jgi:hypothetical protein
MYRERPPPRPQTGPTPWWARWLARLSLISWEPVGIVVLCMACVTEWLVLGCGLLSIPTGIALSKWAHGLPTRGRAHVGILKTGLNTGGYAMEVTYSQAPHHVEQTRKRMTDCKEI